MGTTADAALAKIEREMRQFSARLERHQMREAAKRQKRANRRRLVAGSVLLALLDRRDIMRTVALSLLDCGIDDPVERALFDLDG